MTGMTLARGYGWLRDTLRDDATLTALGHHGVYSVEIPEGTAYPLFLIQHAPGVGTGPVQVIDGTTIYHWIDYRVQAIGRGFDPASLVPLMDRADAVLHQASGTNDGIRLWARHLSEFDLYELTGFYRLGKTYRLAAEAAS